MQMLTDALGVIVAAVVLVFAVKYLGRFLSWVERSEIARQEAEAKAERDRLRASEPARPTTDAEPESVPADHVVAIAAAVAAYGFRVVHIADAPSGHAWASEGRWLHQTSHRTH